jgi:amidase
MGSPIYTGWQSRSDASCVAMLRAAGAVILGKTVTCELAGVAPRETMHPKDPSRTPCGSSSGSAAGVADHMVPIALGTQTGGSILRPAAFCGLIGMKPTYNAVNRQGLLFAAESLDTIGVITRDVADAQLALGVLMNWRPAALEEISKPPRIGLCRTYLWDSKASPATRAAFEAAGARAAAAGATVTEFELPKGFEKLTEIREIINNVERARALAWEWQHHRDRLSPQMIKTVEMGLKVTAKAYDAAQVAAEKCRLKLDREFKAFDALLVPATNGEAPVGLHYAGDPAFQGLWTLLHTPSITVPFAEGPSGMPVGIQLVAQRRRDAQLLSVARWFERHVGKQSA